MKRARRSAAVLFVRAGLRSGRATGDGPDGEMLCDAVGGGTKMFYSTQIPRTRQAEAIQDVPDLQFQRSSNVPVAFRWRMMLMGSLDTKGVREALSKALLPRTRYFRALSPNNIAWHEGRKDDCSRVDEGGCQQVHRGGTSAIRIVISDGDRRLPVEQ